MFICKSLVVERIYKICSRHDVADILLMLTIHTNQLIHQLKTN